MYADEGEAARGQFKKMHNKIFEARSATRQYHAETSQTREGKIHMHAHTSSFKSGRTDFTNFASVSSNAGTGKDGSSF